MKLFVSVSRGYGGISSPTGLPYPLYDPSTYNKPDGYYFRGKLLKDYDFTTLPQIGHTIVFDDVPGMVFLVDAVTHRVGYTQRSVEVCCVIYNMTQEQADILIKNGWEGVK